MIDGEHFGNYMAAQFMKALIVTFLVGCSGGCIGGVLLTKGCGPFYVLINPPEAR